MADLPQIKVTRSRRRSMVLHMLSDGTLEVKAPSYVSVKQIQEFVSKHSDWIKKQEVVSPKKYVDGEKFLYLGKEYSLSIGNFVRIELKDDKLCFPKALEFRIKKEIETWYIRQARELIKKEVEHNAIIMKTTFTSVSFSDTRSKWGSCSVDNRLQFSWRLIMAPHLVLRYVVVHELAHTREKNHSHVFWSRVSPINPSYKEQIKWLKVNGNRLFV